RIRVSARYSFERAQRSTAWHVRQRPALAGPPRHCDRGDLNVSTDATPTWLSQEAYDRLQAELDELIANRPVIAAEINARREEGDLRENGGYHAAREEQGKAEARIRYLQELLRTAQVGDAPVSEEVAPGMVVTIYFD